MQTTPVRNAVNVLPPARRIPAQAKKHAPLALVEPAGGKRTPESARASAATTRSASKRVAQNPEAAIAKKANQK